MVSVAVQARLGRAPGLSLACEAGAEFVTGRRPGKERLLLEPHCLQRSGQMDPAVVALALV